MEKGHTGKRWRVFGLCACLFVCSQFHRVSNAVIAVELSRDLNLSPEGLGLLSAAFFYAFAAMQVPLALLLDRVGGRLAMGGLSVLGATGVVMFSAASDGNWALAGRILIGAGMSGNLMGSLKLISNWFPPTQFATLSGVLMALGTLGNMLATTPLALLAQLLGWRWAMGASGLITALLAVVFLGAVRERPDEAPVLDTRPLQDSPWSKVGELLKLREYWLISWATFFRYGTFVAIQGLWAGPYLMEVIGLSPVLAGNILLVLNLGVILGSPMGGILSDRWLHSRKKVVLIGLALMALGLLGLSVGAPGGAPWGLALLFFLIGASSSFGQVMYAHIKEMVHSEMTGMAMTAINLYTMLGAAAFLQGLGWVVDRWGSRYGSSGAAYGAAFFIAFMGISLALVLYIFTRERKVPR